MGVQVSFDTNYPTLACGLCFGCPQLVTLSAVGLVFDLPVMWYTAQAADDLRKRGLIIGCKICNQEVD